MEKEHPMVIVDLFSGSNPIRHEEFNLKPNPKDDRYYGYCPRNDGIDIDRLGANKKDTKIDGVTVVYVKKIGTGTYNRKIIAFCQNSTVYRKGQIDKNLERTLIVEGKEEHCSYSIVSDNMVNIASSSFDEYIIKTKVNTFRAQRIYKDKHKDIFQDVSSYVESILEKLKEVDRDYMEAVQNTDPQTLSIDSINTNVEPEIINVHGSPAVKRNPSIAKKVIVDAGYKCASDPNHITFKNSRGEQYMEAHHLIPCTPINAKNFWDNYHFGIDQGCNIVSLCPTCHKKIHYGSPDEKKRIIEQLYGLRSKKLEEAKLKITLDELYKLYNV